MLSTLPYHSKTKWRYYNFWRIMHLAARSIEETQKQDMVSITYVCEQIALSSTNRKVHRAVHVKRNCWVKWLDRPVRSSHAPFHSLINVNNFDIIGPIFAVFSHARCISQKLISRYRQLHPSLYYNAAGILSHDTFLMYFYVYRFCADATSCSNLVSIGKFIFVHKL